MAYACNAGIWEVEAGRLRIRGQPGRHSETVAETTKERSRGKERWLGMTLDGKNLKAGASVSGGKRDGRMTKAFRRPAGKGLG